MEENIYQFTEGQTFKTDESVNQYFHKFCEHNYHPFVVRSHSKKQIVYKCCHGVERKSKCRGERPNQHYFFKGCTAKINLYKNKENKWKVTKVSLNHNHSISREEYSFYQRNAKLKKDNFESITDLVLKSAKDSMIAEVLEKQYGGRLTSENDSDTNLDENFDDCENNENKNQILLTDKEKYNMAFNAIKNLADVLSHHGTPSFLNYMQELKMIENNARQGSSLLNSLENNELIQNQSETLQETRNMDVLYTEELSLRNSENEETEYEIASLADSNESETNLKFRSRIKCKGRSKTKGKQTTFNRKLK